MKVLAEQPISESANQELARFAKALAHPTRLQILQLLDSQACCFNGDLVEIIPAAQSTISQHLRELIVRQPKICDF